MKGVGGPLLKTTIYSDEDNTSSLDIYNVMISLGLNSRFKIIHN